MYTNILVTGGAGFIGSHVVDELLAAGYKVRVLDSLNPPTHDGTAPAWLNPAAEMMVGDVRNKDDWRKALAGIDAIVHLAAYMDFRLDFSTYIRTNIESVALLFELIVEEHLPIKKIIAASSQSVYGEGKYRCEKHGVMYLNPRTETQLAAADWEQHCPHCGEAVEPVAELEEDELHPEIPYAISKLASEQLLLKLGRLYNIPTVALRFSIVLGARQSFRHFYSGALRSFAVNALNNEPILMNEDAKQLRDFVHVSDVAAAHRLALEDDRANGEVYNVGSGVATQVMELAQLVAAEAHVPFQPVLNNRYRVGGMRHSVMDASKLRALGWKPEHDLRAMVRDYLVWIKQFGDVSQILKANEKKMLDEGILKKSV